MAPLAALLVALLAILPIECAHGSEVAARAAPGCVIGGGGFLRARMRGALDLDIAWSDAQMECDGGPRPDGKGLRVTIAGPGGATGRRLRFVFGIADTAEGSTVTARSANLTVIFEGEQRIFATRGDDKCTLDELRQDRIGALGGPRRSWKVAGRGFCIAPATAIRGAARVLVSRFDFASQITFEDAADHAPLLPRRLHSPR